MEKVRFAIVGTGLWGESHALVYARDERVELAAVCDVRGERAREVAQRYGAAKWCSDYREVMADPSIRAVSVATPDFAHAEIAVAAAQAGKHLLVEKPLATSVQDCERIMAAARAAGVKLMVDFHNHWNPPLYAARQAIAAGEIGAPQLIYLRLHDTIFVPTGMLSWASQSTVGWFLGSHTVDLVCWLLGERPRRVYALSASRVLEERGIRTPDFYQGLLEFPSGAVANTDNGWIMPNTSPSIIDFQGRIVGSKGALSWNLSHHRALEKYTEDKGIYPDVLGKYDMHGGPTGFTLESIRHFVDCVLQDKEPLCTGEDGLWATRIICAMEESVRQQRPVELAG